ncbi:hypothetical protein EYF80_042103 [Liparis tanakae]|uniref:Uncharacterized protein n=1 Tax=Liparis tanakae TaxID=230148 RepID=A0A4Z2G481_9TELE|nr:hypothetical protein EYF80_042103 [Liparis tanakae]
MLSGEPRTGGAEEHIWDRLVFSDRALERSTTQVTSLEVAVMHPSTTPSPASLQGSISFKSLFHQLITTTRSGLHGSISLLIRAASPQLQISP